MWMIEWRVEKEKWMGGIAVMTNINGDGLTTYEVLRMECVCEGDHWRERRSRDCYYVHPWLEVVVFSILGAWPVETHQ
jgi:hypothetical protein